MITAYLDAMRRYASFDGRTSRGGYWWYAITVSVLHLAALAVDGVSGGLDRGAAPVFGLVALAHALPNLGVMVRRLHDADRSGWFILVDFIPLVGPIVLLVWFCERGTRGPNRFGPDPFGAFDGVATLPPNAPAVGAPARSGHRLAAAMRDVVGEIERLARLRASGTLSDAEFEVLKAQAMAGYGRA